MSDPSDNVPTDPEGDDADTESLYGAAPDDAMDDPEAENKPVPDALTQDYGPDNPTGQ